MSGPEILDLIHRHGGTATLEAGKVKLRAPAPLPQDLTELARRHKDELRQLLAEEWAGLPLRDLEQRHLALRIESREYGRLWLVSTEAEQSLADDGEPVYTVEEARKLIGLPEAMVHQIHAFKRVFGGSSLDREVGGNAYWGQP